MIQGEIWMANLDPTRGSEQAGFRPILVFSGNLFNTHTPLIIGLPLSTKIKNYQKMASKKNPKYLLFTFAQFQKSALLKRSAVSTIENLKN